MPSNVEYIQQYTVVNQEKKMFIRHSNTKVQRLHSQLPPNHPVPPKSLIIASIRFRLYCNISSSGSRGGKTGKWLRIVFGCRTGKCAGLGPRPTMIAQGRRFDIDKSCFSCNMQRCLSMSCCSSSMARCWSLMTSCCSSTSNLLRCSSYLRIHHQVVVLTLGSFSFISLTHWRRKYAIHVCKREGVYVATSKYPSRFLI